MKTEIATPEKKSLFDITTQQRELINEIEMLEGEITPEIEEKLIITKGEIQQKSIAYLELIGAKESFNSRIDAEIKRLQQMKKVNTNLVDRLNQNLLLAVKTFGEYTVGMQKFGTRKSSQVIVDINTNDLPKKYKRITVTEAPDKTAIGNDLKAGKKIKGCRIQENINLKIN